MARVRFSGLVVDIRGSIGSTTLQKNAYGYTIKNKANVIRPNTSFQDTTKRRFLQCIQAWQSLTQSQQSLWNTFAENIKQFSKNNLSAQLSGYAVFIKWNMNSLISGEDINTNPGGFVPLVPNFHPLITAGLGILVININPDSDETNITCNIYISGAINVAKNYTGSLPRYIDSIPLQEGEVSIYTQYLQRIGQTLLSGNIVFMSIVMLSNVSAYVFAKRNYKIIVG